MRLVVKVGNGSALHRIVVADADKRGSLKLRLSVNFIEREFKQAIVVDVKGINLAFVINDNPEVADGELRLGRRCHAHIFGRCPKSPDEFIILPIVQVSDIKVVCRFVGHEKSGGLFKLIVVDDTLGSTWVEVIVLP